MGALYLAFAAIPVLAVIAACFPRLTGRGEPVPVGGFEYTLFAPRRYLVGGACGIGAFGILFLLVLDGVIEPEDVRVATAALLLFLVGEGASIFSVVHYFAYRLTVRGGLMLYKIPARRELCVPIAEAEWYSVRVSPFGRTSAVIAWKGKRIFAEGDSTELLLAELEHRNVKKK